MTSRSSRYWGDNFDDDRLPFGGWGGDDRLMNIGEYSVSFDLTAEQIDIYRSMLDDAERKTVMTLKTPAFKLGQKAGESMATGLVNKKQSEQRLVIQYRPGRARTDVSIEQVDPETGDVQFRFQIDQKIIKDLSVNSAFGGYEAPSVELKLECDTITTVHP